MLNSLNAVIAVVARPGFRRASSARFVTLGIVVCALVLGATLRAQSSTPRSVKDGVYSSKQAERGGSLYEEKCTSCHAARMWGSDWTERSVWDIYDTINSFMPQDSPGSLSPQETRDIVAYILKTNKIPGGVSDLPESPDALKQIRIELP